ncbi:MAG: hypothetical protein ACFFEJ_04340 [Candidatus Thorarchaeota archaeon]
MTKSILPPELQGQFLGVGSIKEDEENEALDYVLDLKLPYAYQKSMKPEEDMIRQFGASLEGFEDKGTFIYDVGYDDFQGVIDEDAGIIPNQKYFSSLHELLKKGSFRYLKTQLTAPATMCFSIRGEDGRQHLTPQMFRFFSRLMARVATGYVSFLERTVENLIICQDDPSFGFITEAIEVGNVSGLSARFIMKTTDEIYPKNVIPAYHYCYDWRVLAENGYHLIWQSKPKIAHLDMIAYPPELEANQAELVNSFLQSGGAIALGVIPNVDSAYSEPVLSYFEKALQRSISLMIKSGISIDLLESNTMVSTQCGLSGASPALSREIHQNSRKYPEIVDKIYMGFR